jgi:hypothetical protein
MIVEPNDIVQYVGELLEKQGKVLQTKAKQYGSFDLFKRAAQHAEMEESSVIWALIGVKRAKVEADPFNEDALVDLLNYLSIATVMAVQKKRNAMETSIYATQANVC